MTRAFTLLLFTLSVCSLGNPIPVGFLIRPLPFEPNRGQAAPSVRFVARGNSHDYLLSGSGVTVSGASLRFLGAKAEPRVSAQEPLGERHNYFHGAASQTDIPTYRRVRYSRLYPGIDCVFYGDQKGLEFDFEVSPGADPDKIRFRWNDATRVRLDANGELVIETVSGDLRQRKPTVYQERNGRRILIAGSYVLAADGEIRFSLGSYDRRLPVIIDPVLFALDQGVIPVAAMAADPGGNVYLTGSTSASVLPTTVGTVQPAFGGGTCSSLPVIGGGFTFPCPDAFVIKLDPMGQLVYATYLGGQESDGGIAIAVDLSGNAYVAGNAGSSNGTSNFPITPTAAFPKPGSTGHDGFISKLNPAGNQLVYSTFIPNAPPVGIALDPLGNVYLVSSANLDISPFPVTPGAFQTSTSSSSTIGLVAKLNAAGSGLIYATYLGGTGGDSADGIAVDPLGNAYVTGSSHSLDFPTTPVAFQTKLPAQTGSAYVAKIAPTGASLVYSTFLGGSGGGDDSSRSAIKVDSQGDAIVLRRTISTDFPVTAGAFQPTGPAAPWEATDNQNVSAFLSKLNPTGSALIYSTYVAGASALDVDSAGNAYVLGTATYGFPTTAGAYQPCSHGGLSDIFAAEFDPDGKLTGATYLGGSGEDTASGIVALGGGSIYLAGFTSSSDFPGIVGLSNLELVAKILINDPNRSSIPCLAYTVQNAATFIEGPVAPGEVVTLRGKGIGPQEGVSAKIGSDGKISAELAGVKVLFGELNNPAPLLYVQSEQINAVVPWEAGMDALNMSVQVEYNGSVIGTFVPEYPVAPGIFLSDYSTQQAAVLNADGTPNSPKNPAKRGSVISFYGTGGGPMNPSAITGGIWPAVSPLAQLALPVSVQIGNAEADVRYAGSAPGLVSGIFQINVLVPDSLSTGQNPIIVSIGGKSSPQSTAYLSVQ